VLATVVAAQFMFGVDAFIVNVAIPTIAAELHASAAQIEAVMAVYLIAYATLVVTGGRLGDVYGAARVHIRRPGLRRHLAVVRPGAIRA
jgi:MFS family permease